MKLTLFGVRCHLLHESDEVEQELGVVVGQLQIIAVLPEEQKKRFNAEKRRLKTYTFMQFALLLPYLSLKEGHTAQSGDA